MNCEILPQIILKMLNFWSILLLHLTVFVATDKEDNIFEHIDYRYTLDIGNPADLCPADEKICSNKKPHYLCEEKSTPADCPNFKAIKMDNRLKKSFVDGHNGIRNKVAENLKIANMNLVYWSRELSIMAENFLKECYIGPDACHLLGEREVRVGQNYVFREGHLADRWPGRVVRQWYLEIGFKVHNLADLKKNYKSGKMNNFTQMTWPLLEFIGCSAARMHSGSLVVCYYHPPVMKAAYESHLQPGKPCTRCDRARPTCSRTFVALCGIDVEMEGASVIRNSLYLLIICNLFFLW